MTSSYRIALARVTGAVLLLAASSAVASVFIAGSRVTEADSSDDPHMEIGVRFNCKASYLRHEPQESGDQLRIFLDPTNVCNGVPSSVVQTRSRFRPFNSDAASLVDIEYDGESSSEVVLTLSFSETVAFDVEMPSLAFELAVSVSNIETIEVAADEPDSPAPLHRLVERKDTNTADWAINLLSMQRPPAPSDFPQLSLSGSERIYYSEVRIDGKDWYRLRVGDFDSAESASAAMRSLRKEFPSAWIEQVDPQLTSVEMTSTDAELTLEVSESADDTAPGSSKVDLLMEDARKAMAADEVSRAVQIYTKVLQLPDHSRLPEAQEFLALAREKKGQLAHARAEYQRYLSLYPDTEGATRVSQRLAALVSVDQQESRATQTAAAGAEPARKQPSDWRIQTFFSQFYRRDVNQQNDQEEIVSQSAIYSDVNFDARRRGKRFDFSSRLSAGYRNDFLDAGSGGDDSARVSYAFVDLADADLGLRARLGRQSRNNGGVLGRFDGLNLGYELGERILINAVYGRPAYSSNDSIDSARSFYGTSVNYRPNIDGLELGVFYLEQDIEGITDRKAVGTEFRYFGEKQSIWGLVDYDTSYSELGSAFLQTSWRFRSRFSVHGSFDRRHSPFLSAGNALIGQPVLEFSEMLELFLVDEIRQLGLDRSPLSTTFSVGLSHALSPRLQINADFSRSSIDPTPASGGVEATPSSEYNYYSASMVASSLLKEGDITILTTRYSDSGTAKVTSLTLDTRYPIGRTWRINPRLRVDRRQRLGAADYEWLYTPGIRIQYRRSQKFRFMLEAGKQFSQHDTTESNLDRESYFVNLGYQAFF